MRIRPETAGDKPRIYRVNKSAFETSAEADLVDVLREQARPIVSLVAEIDTEIAGHILFSPVIVNHQNAVKVMGLAPMAVAPQHQRRGIGTRLVEHGLEHCKRLSFGAVVVLGHTNYYPKFGFSPTSQFDICCEYDVPEEAFMALELEKNYLKNTSGVAVYHSAFGAL